MERKGASKEEEEEGGFARFEKKHFPFLLVAFLTNSVRLSRGVFK